MRLRRGGLWFKWVDMLRLRGGRRIGIGVLLGGCGRGEGGR